MNNLKILRLINNNIETINDFEIYFQSFFNINLNIENIEIIDNSINNSFLLTNNTINNSNNNNINVSKSVNISKLYLIMKLSKLKYYNSIEITKQDQSDAKLVLKPIFELIDYKKSINSKRIH